MRLLYRFLRSYVGMLLPWLGVSHSPLKLKSQRSPSFSRHSYSPFRTNNGCPDISKEEDVTEISSLWPSLPSSPSSGHCVTKPSRRILSRWFYISCWPYCWLVEHAVLYLEHSLICIIDFYKFQLHPPKLGNSLEIRSGAYIWLFNNSYVQIIVWMNENPDSI